MAGPAPLGSPFPQNTAITGTPQVAAGATNSIYQPAAGYDAAAAVGANQTGLGYGVAPATGATNPSTMLGPAIQTIWSKEILFQAMPILRFEQFAVKKTELGVTPGLTIEL